MAPSKSYQQHGLKVAVLIAVAFIFSLAMLLTPQSSVDGLPSSSLKQRNKVLGSRPPACINKCGNCRPCMPTLVVPSHQKKVFFAFKDEDEDDGHYYLLSWKCRCGDKLYQP